MNASGRRVVVTGIGLVAPTGHDADAYWTSLTAPIDRPPPTSLDPFDPTEWMTKPEVRRSDDRIQFAVAAAARALDDAGAPDVAGLSTGVLVGNAHGAAGRIVAETAQLPERGAKAVTPFLALLAADNAPAAAIAQRAGARGTCQMVGGACASGTYAIGDAARLVAAGVCDVMLAGATAGAVPEVLTAAYANLRVVATSGFVRPFDARRDGFVYTTGAAVLVLEAHDHATARDARVYGEIVGYASTNDAFHPIQQSGSGAVECMRLALRTAGLAPADIAHVNAHGSATTLNDEVEAAAIHEVFDPHRPSVTSIKRVTGHSLGAAGAFEAASVLLSFAHRSLPPAGIDFEPDAALDLDVVHGAARAWTPGPTISNSFGLGGQNGTLVMVPPT